MVRKINEYPDYKAYIDYIDENGFTDEIVNKIISKHQNNRAHTQDLYGRYKTEEDSVPIFSREPRFEQEGVEELNNKINNDFFSEIVDIKIGYYAGKAANYTYGSTEDSEADVEAATKALTDFTTRNNMYDANMETTKYASICGYAGRLFYIDKEGNERVKITPPYETIILSRGSMSEPEYAIRYYDSVDVNDATVWKAEAYDSSNIYYYEGQLGGLTQQEDKTKPHMFDYCPLQGVPNNEELLGDAEKVIELIDEYDRGVSDNANDAEGNTQAHMVFQDVFISDEEMVKARKSGAIKFNGTTGNSSIYYLTKQINDTFNENHLKRIEQNIYRFSKTPNLNDQAFGGESGEARKFKITGLETKCGMFEAKMSSADTYMFKVLQSSFVKKRIPFDYLQCYVTYKRNFPLALLAEAQAATALKGAGLPDEVVYGLLSFVDDVDYILDLKEQAKENIPSLFGNVPDDDADDSKGSDNDDNGDGKIQNEE